MSAQLTKEDHYRLQEIAKNIRANVIRMLYLAGSGHPAGSLSMVDILVYLYFQQINHQPEHPNWEGRDYVLMSNGHHCPALYATLAEAGYFPVEELATLRKMGSRLQGHPQRGLLPGVEISAGSLAQGISQAVGLALALRMDQKKNHVFCTMSDGEYQEGQTWEALLLATKYQLGNLSIILDANDIQISGKIADTLAINPLFAKLKSFGWNVLEVNGHDFYQIQKAIEKDLANDFPSVIICHTVAGKGVSFMEKNSDWHGKAPNQQEAAQALKEILE
ncbi:MAG: transketolase [Patescibacteria group bacterium]